MHDALFAAASGMSAVSKAMEMAAHNAANSQTPGYQARVPKMSSFQTALERASGLKGSLVSTTESTSNAQGHFVDGPSPLSVAIRGQGYLALRSPEGTLYTRNGDLRMGADGTLRGVNGLPVLSGGQPATVDPTGSPPTIDAQGRLLQDGLELGRLDVVEFDDLTALERRGDVLFAAPPSAGAHEATNSDLVPGMLELPAERSVSALVGMIAASRAFEASQRVISTVNQSFERALRNRG